MSAEKKFLDEEFRAFMEYHVASLVSAKFFYTNMEPAWTMLVEYSDTAAPQNISPSSSPVPQKIHTSQQPTPFIAPAELRSILPPPVDTFHVLSEEEKVLYHCLRLWRNQKAKECGYSPCILFTNEQLAKMAKQKPCTLESLRKIQGIGDGKEEKYGQIVIGIIQNFLQKRQQSNG